jgi:hypothetical protein
MRLQSLSYAVLAATLLVAPACGRTNNAVGEMRPDAVANDRAARVTNTTDNPEGTQAGSADRDQKTTGTAGSLSRAADDVERIGGDATITMKIQAKYAGDDIVKGRNIDVDTSNGVVTLKGKVDSLRQRDAAEQLARETEGVKRVVNELKLAQ